MGDNSPSIHHQDEAIFELFSHSLRAEKLDEERGFGVCDLKFASTIE